MEFPERSFMLHCVRWFRQCLIWHALSLAMNKCHVIVCRQVDNSLSTLVWTIQPVYCLSSSIIIFRWPPVFGGWHWLLRGEFFSGNKTTSFKPLQIWLVFPIGFSLTFLCETNFRQIWLVLKITTNTLFLGIYPRLENGFKRRLWNDQIFSTYFHGVFPHCQRFRC